MSNLVQDVQKGWEAILEFQAQLRKSLENPDVRAKLDKIYQDFEEANYRLSEADRIRSARDYEAAFGERVFMSPAFAY